MSSKYKEKYEFRINALVSQTLLSVEATKLREIKSSGGSCKTCTHTRKKSYTLHCMCPHKKDKGKVVQSYNVCHLFLEKSS